MKNSRGDVTVILAILFSVITISIVVLQQLIASQRIRLLYQLSEKVGTYEFNEINTWRLFYRDKAGLALDTPLLTGSTTVVIGGVSTVLSYLSTGKSKPGASTGGSGGGGGGGGAGSGPSAGPFGAGAGGLISSAAGFNIWGSSGAGGGGGGSGSSTGAKFCAGTGTSQLCIGNKPVFPTGNGGSPAPPCTALDHALTLSPIAISTPAELKAMTNGKYFQLANDIVLTGHWDSLSAKSLVLDGQGHSISGLVADKLSVVSGSNYLKGGVGLFGNLECSIVRNLKFESPSIVVAAIYNAGVVSGYAKHSSIDNVIVNGGTVESNAGVGMLVGGLQNSTISNSRVNGGTVTHHMNVSGTGGIVGMVNYDLTPTEASYLFRVSSDATVIGLQGTPHLGSLVGWIYGNLRIEQSSAFGQINPESSTAVGMLGNINTSDGNTRAVTLELIDVLSSFVDPRTNVLQGRYSGLIASWAFHDTHQFKFKNIFVNSKLPLIGAFSGDPGDLPTIVMENSYAPSPSQNFVGRTSCKYNNTATCEADLASYLESHLNTGFQFLDANALITPASYQGWDFTNTWNFVSPNTFPTLRNPPPVP